MNRSIRIPRVIAFHIRATLIIWFSAAILVAGGTAVSGYPFCSAASRTLTEELELSDAAVLAKLGGPDAADPDTGDARFQVTKVLTGLGDETTIVPRERLVASARLLLDNAEIAEQVIPGLARWEDWSVMERLVDMFKTSNASGYIRRPVVAYLLAAAEQPAPVGTRAAEALIELEQLDPEEVQRARSTMGLGFLARARTVDPAPGATRPVAVAARNDEADAGAMAPDPAEFDGEADSEATPAADENEDVGASVASPDLPAMSPAAASPAAEAVSPLATNTLLVVGLPVGAMLLLAGVFWLILRGGAG